MADQLLKMPAAQRVKMAAMKAVPAGVRPALRDLAQRRRLTRGVDALGQPEDHQRFLVEHLPRLAIGPRDRPVYVEFGVYQGASLAAAVQAFDQAGIRDARFVGLDSFAGLPPGSDAEGWGDGWFVTSRRTTEWNLRRLGVAGRCELVEGWFSDTCTPELAARLGRADVVMIDCDVYSATVTALEFIVPLLAPRALVIFDDWYEFDRVKPRTDGQPRALAELLARTPGLTATELGRVSYCGVGFELTTAPVRAVTEERELQR